MFRIGLKPMYPLTSLKLIYPPKFHELGRVKIFDEWVKIFADISAVCDFTPATVSVSAPPAWEWRRPNAL